MNTGADIQHFFLSLYNNLVYDQISAKQTILPSAN